MIHTSILHLDYYNTDCVLGVGGAGEALGTPTVTPGQCQEGKSEVLPWSMEKTFAVLVLLLVGSTQINLG